MPKFRLVYSSVTLMASFHTDLYYSRKTSHNFYSSPDPIPRFVRRCLGDCRGDLFGDLSARKHGNNCKSTLADCLKLNL